MSIVFGRWDGSTAQSVIHGFDLAYAPSGTCRSYLDLFQSYTGSYSHFCLERNRTHALNIHSWTNQPRHAIPWSDIVSGKHDTPILANVQDYKALRTQYPDAPPANMVFHHEPENEENGKVSGDLPAGEHCGTREEFKAAFEHVRSIWRSVLTVDEALIGCTLMAGRYASGDWTTWVPPRYQFLGIDGYSHGNVNKQGVNTETFSNIFTPAHNAAVQAGRKLFIQEVGCAETPGRPNFKPEFFGEMRVLAKTWPELIGIETSNVRAKEDYRIATTPDSENAYRALAADAYYKGDWS